ncbi:MAG: hypothetical protein AB8G14_17330 [Ilumatobacter sp.]
MTDQNESVPGADPGAHHDVQLRLGVAADAVDLGDSSVMLDTVRAAASRRRRRRQGVGAIAAVGALGISGVVLANVAGGDDGELVVSAPVTDPIDEADSEADPAITEGVEAEVIESEVVDAESDNAPVTVPDDGVLQVTPTNSETASDESFSVEQGTSFGPIEVYPWKDGFLSIRTEFLPQRLPAELPASISDRFSPEVLELFADGLPPTIEEATQMLQEAGLYGEVSDLVLSDPDVSAAIYSQQTEMVTTVRVSADGLVWDDIDVELPDDEPWGQVSAAGDRLSFISFDQGAEPHLGPNDGPKSVTVWSSTDLASWESQEIAIPASPVGLPDFVSFDYSPSDLAVNADGWVLGMYEYSFADMSEFLDVELAAREAAGEVYLGTSMSVDGVRVEVYDPMEGSSEGPPSPEIIQFTWDELGVDSVPDESVLTGGSAFDGGGEIAMFAAEWGGVPVQSETGVSGSVGFGRVVSTSEGFVSVGQNVLVSSDGLRWSPVDLPFGGYSDWVVETDDGLLISATDESGGQGHFLFDPASSEFAPIDLPDIPDGAAARRIGTRFVQLTKYDESDGSFGSEGWGVTAEVEGYAFEMKIMGMPEGASSTYTLTDVSTGEVVLTETTDGLGDEDGAWEFLVDDYESGAPEGIRLFDPDTGDELLFIPGEVMEGRPLDADGEPLSDEPITSIEYSGSITFVVAAVGGDLVVEDLSSAGGPGPGFSSMAVNGDVLLVASYDGTFTRITAS